jgi:hypothetical protein
LVILGLDFVNRAFLLWRPGVTDLAPSGFWFWAKLFYIFNSDSAEFSSSIFESYVALALIIDFSFCSAEVLFELYGIAPLVFYF